MLTAFLVDAGTAFDVIPAWHPEETRGYTGESFHEVFPHAVGTVTVGFRK